MRAEAYADIYPYITELQSKVLALLKSHPEGLTGSEATAITGMYGYTVRPRLTELFKLGYVTKAGSRPNPRGNRETVYRIVSSLA